MSRRWVIGSTATVVVAAVGLVVVFGGGWHDDDPPAVSASSSPTSAPTIGSLGASDGGGSDGDASDGDASDGGTPDRGGSEVISQPENSASEGLPGLSKAKGSSTESLVSGPLPRTAARRGTVVAGFPLTVIPVMTGSTVHSSGVSSTFDALQISIVARSPRSPSSILGFYRGVLSGLGFAESAVPAVEGSTAAGFKRGTDHLVLTVTKRSAEGTTYSLFGALHTSAND